MDAAIINATTIVITMTAAIDIQFARKGGPDEPPFFC
jgi:hypothetical protein